MDTRCTQSYIFQADPTHRAPQHFCTQLPGCCSFFHERYFPSTNVSGSLLPQIRCGIKSRESFGRFACELREATPPVQRQSFGHRAPCCPQTNGAEDRFGFGFGIDFSPVFLSFIFNSISQLNCTIFFNPIVEYHINFIGGGRPPPPWPTRRRLKLRVVQKICRQLLRALEYLHSREPPVIHSAPGGPTGENWLGGGGAARGTKKKTKHKQKYKT